MTTILLVEDDPSIRITTEFVLTQSGYAVSAHEDGDSGLDAALVIEPDLVLLDVMLPGIDGLEVCKRLRAKGFRSPIIMLTALGTDENKVEGLDAGADDYITKPFSTDELLARIRAHLRRSELDGVRTSAPQEFGDLVIDRDGHAVSVKGQPVKLREKEWALLLALSGRNGLICSRSYLSQNVWEENYLSTSRTIDAHIRRLRSALDETSDYSFIHTIHGVGYRFEAVRK